MADLLLWDYIKAAMYAPDICTRVQGIVVWLSWRKIVGKGFLVSCTRPKKKNLIKKKLLSGILIHKTVQWFYIVLKKKYNANKYS